MDLYYFPSSHWSRIVSLVLAEKGLEPTRHFVDIRKNATFEPEYMRLNPRGVVPTLVDSGVVVWDSPRIVAHLDGKPGPPACDPPGSPEAGAWAARLEDFPLMHLSYVVWVRGLRGERSREILEDKIERARHYARTHPDLREQYERKRAFFEEFRAGIYDPERCAVVERECRATLDEMADVVTARPFLGGDDWSFADAIATSILYRLNDLQYVHEWHDTAGSPLRAYFDRLRQRRSFEKVWLEDQLIPT